MFFPCVVCLLLFMVTMDDRLPSIEKLDEPNWPVWKLQMQAYLKPRQLWSLCAGTKTEHVAPAEGSDDDAVNAYTTSLSAYQVRVARTKSILLQMLCTSQAHVIA